MNERLLSILVIDDQKEILELVRLTLKPLKWTVNAARTPQEGLALARSLVPDVILCDAAMPKMSGPEVIQILKTDPATAHIPVVLVTGTADS
jgi:CheY-like chemotaxis protein